MPATQRFTVECTMRYRQFIGIAAGAVACAWAAAACTQSDPTAGNPLPIIVSADTVLCTVLEQQVPCSGIPTYLVDDLKTPTSKLIIFSDRKTGRTDDEVTMIVDELRKAGYSKVMVVGEVTRRP
jgi:hypothetical protein